MKRGMFLPDEPMKLDIEHIFRRTDDADDPIDELKAIRSRGRIPLLTVEPWEEDFGALTVWCDEIRKLPFMVYLRYAHEMNGDWYPWAGGPARHIANFRRVATEVPINVRMVWCPNITFSSQLPQIEAYWPGAEAVDVIGLDGYDWDGSTSFQKLFAADMARIDGINRTLPRWICETATPQTSGRQAQWVSAMIHSAKAWPDLKAVVWFNESKEQNWRMSALSSKVFQAWPDRK